MSLTTPSGPTGGRSLGEHSDLTKRLIREGLQPRTGTIAPLTGLPEARRAAACVELDIADAMRSRGQDRLQHVRDALARAEALVNTLRQAEAEARGVAA
jgi:hypothetical protein